MMGVAVSGCQPPRPHPQTLTRHPHRPPPPHQTPPTPKQVNFIFIFQQQQKNDSLVFNPNSVPNHPSSYFDTVFIYK